MRTNPQPSLKKVQINLGRVVLFLVVGAGSIPACLRAGDLLTLSATPATNGKLTLLASTLHVDGATPRDVSISDVLEANFSDGPFHLQYFNSASVRDDKLPPDWATKTIDQTLPSGSASFSGGKLTITGDGGDPLHPKDHYFFAGIPWTGNGQWTANFREIGPSVSNGSSPTEVIMTLRSGLDEGDTMFGMGVNDNGNLTLHNGGYRGMQGQFPIKLRVTRFNKSLETSFLDNTNTWQIICEDGALLTDKFWVGFMINSHDKNNVGRAVIDQILFTPAPAQPEVIPPGILLKSGTFLAGDTFRVGKDGGEIQYGLNNRIAYKYEDVAAAVYHPVTMKKLAEINSQPGAMMLNGDFLAADIQTIGATNGGGMTTLISETLGPLTYFTDKVCALSVNPLDPKPSAYEIRLHSGSIIRATGFDFVDGTNPTVVIHEISQKTPIVVGPVDIAQIRAGETRVQPLLQVPWKEMEQQPAIVVSPDKNTSAKPPLTGTAGSDNGDIATWTGPDQEQIMVAPAGAKILFPLRGKFQSVAMRLAMAPGAPPHARTMLTFSVDSKKLANAITLNDGEEPVAVDIPVSNPKSVMLSIDAAPAGTQVLLIDPVAVRTNTAGATSSPKKNSSDSTIKSDYTGG